MTLHYEGRVFRPAGPLPGDLPGDLPTDGLPTGRYHQEGDMVWAEFGDGQRLMGRLVGRRRPDGSIDAAYCQVSADGDVVAGRCVSVPTVLPDGRLRLEERWRRIDGTSGVSFIEELTP
jgi:hypothetical protein